MQILDKNKKNLFEGSKDACKQFINKHGLTKRDYTLVSNPGLIIETTELKQKPKELIIEPLTPEIKEDNFFKRMFKK